MKKIIKWLALVMVCVVLVSLFYYVKEKKKRPGISGDELLRLALIEIKEHQNYPKAIELSRQALTISPGYTDVRVTLARAYMLNGELDSAKAQLEKALGNDPRNADGLLYLVNISMQKKDTASALLHLAAYNNYFPSERESMLKEFLLLLAHREYKKADSAYFSYTKTFKTDSIRMAAYNFWALKGNKDRILNDLSSAYRSYRNAIQYHPGQTDVLQQLVNLSMYFADDATALKYNTELLTHDTLNRQYLITESAIYQKVNDKENAALFATRAYKLRTTDEVAKKNLIDLYLSFAKDETNVNKIHYANLALAISPEHRETLLLLINTYLESEQYTTALEVINRALSYYPNDPVLFDKKTGTLVNTKNYQSAITYIESILKEKQPLHVINIYEDIVLKIATQCMKQHQWSDAFLVLKKGLAYQPDNISLLEELENVYSSLHNTTAAVSTINQLLAISPYNETYLFKKSGLLEAQQMYADAAEISAALTRKHPLNESYKNAYLDQLLNAEKMAVLQQDWNRSIDFYNRAALTGDPGYFHLVYAIAAYNGKSDFWHVVQLTDTALGLYPGDSLFLVKKSLAYSAVSYHTEALLINRSLLKKYPSDTALQAMYLDQLYTAGKYYEKENKNDSAIQTFLTAHEVAPKDTFALMNLSAIYFIKKQYDSSITYADKGLLLNGDNEYLLMKKAAAHEQLKQYRSAYASAEKVFQLHPSKALGNYRDFLKNKTYRNQLGITHLQSIFSSPGQYASVSGLQYMHRFEKGSITGKLNHGDRPAGLGIQGGLDVYYTHDSAYYSNIFFNASSGKSFPYWQAGYSLFRNFKKGWEGELGVRYLGFDSINNYTATAAIGKYIKSTWLTLRSYYTYNTKDWFQSYLLTARQYLNDKNDYLSLIAGLGNIPDDQSLNYQLNNFSGFTSKSIGVGFQKTFRYRTMLQVFLNYNNLQVTQSRKTDQYDIYITLLRNF